MTARSTRARARRSTLFGSFAVVMWSFVGCGGESGLLDTALTSRDGKTTTLGAEVSDRPLLVSLWAVWCQPCRRELPELQRIARDSDSSVDVLAVNIGDDAARVDDFLAELDLDLPVALDLDGEVLEAIGAPSVPATVIVDPDGRVVWKKIGALEDGEVESVIAALEG